MLAALHNGVARLGDRGGGVAGGSSIARSRSASSVTTQSSSGVARISSARWRLHAERDRISTEYAGLMTSAADRAVFEEKLRLARVVFPYVENHNFYVEHWGHATIWRKMRELGRMPALGVPPERVTEPFTIMLWGITEESITQWLGTGTGDQQGELTGMAASPGVAEGPARVISSPGQIDELRDGEILVAPLTAPSWAPIFGKVRAHGDRHRRDHVARRDRLPRVWSSGSDGNGVGHPAHQDRTAHTRRRQRWACHPPRRGRAVRECTRWW
jgi:hypothetical protein